MPRLTSRERWLLVILALGLVAAGLAWLAISDAPVARLLVRLYKDKQFLKDTLREWGVLAPVVFMVVQALQVVISPIPGEATGFLGGYLFGQWLGFIYSTIGLTAGSIVAFWGGRWLGEHFVRNAVSRETWEKLGFIVEAEGAILCFIIYLVPGLPKDIVCYLFGISPMPLWVFAVVSGLGRMPGTWLLSTQGAKTEAGLYIEAIAVAAIGIAVALPLYYYRHRMVAWYRGRRGWSDRTSGPGAPGGGEQA